MRRPFTQIAALGLGGHVFFELAAGAGMPLASVIGPGQAAGLWAAATAGTVREAQRRPGTKSAVFGLVNGFGLAAVLGHFSAWPKERTRLGLPWLADCEGLGRELMPAYNTILYVSAVASLGGLVRESSSGRRMGLLFAIAAAPVLVIGQRWEFQRLQRLAEQRPNWWNRALQRGVPTSPAGLSVDTD